MISCYLCALNLFTMNIVILPLMIGWPQIVLIIVVVLLLFGGKKIPELMRGLGSGLKEFKEASKDESDDTTKLDDKK